MSEDEYRRCPMCGTAMTRVTREDVVQDECPDDRCHHIEPFYPPRPPLRA